MTPYNNGRTIGYGFDFYLRDDISINFNADGSITSSEADRLLCIMLDETQEKLNDFLKENDLYVNQNTYDASMDLLYNRNQNVLTEEVIFAMANQNDDKVLKLLEDFDYRYAEAYLKGYPQAYVDRNPGLKERREAEYELYKFGSYN